MEKARDVFIVLTYINSEDLLDFINSAKATVKDSRIIVVNSYHDNDSAQKIREIAQNEGCDFLEVPNKGYSYGNNKGIEYACERYDFEYLTVSNPDIIILKYNTSSLKDNTGIYSGIIKNKTGKNQNPMLVKENRISDYLLYKGYQDKSKLALTAGLCLNKIIRETFLFFHRNRGKTVKVFQPHGSFITFSKNAITVLGNAFDDHVFLFGEEGILAKRAKGMGIPVYYSDFAICLHKEDGSMKLSDVKMDDEYGKSVKYYYENYAKATRRNR